MRPSFPPSSRAFITILSAAWLACAVALPAHGDALADAQRLLNQGQYPEALARVDSHLAAKPDDAAGRFLRGLILGQAGRSSEAIAVFVALNEDHPDLPEPYNNLAVLYAQQRQYEQARSALEMAVRVHPAYAVAYENLGDVQVQLASEAYAKAMQIDPANKRAGIKLNLSRELIARPASGTSSAATASTGSDKRSGKR
jgi:tetratricopeptide (TPR) repeat protein